MKLKKWPSMSAVTLAIPLNHFLVPPGNYIHDVMIRQASSGIGKDRLPGTSKVLSGIATHADSRRVNQRQQHFFTT